MEPDEGDGDRDGDGNSDGAGDGDGEGQGDGRSGFRAPPPPDDRLWRHPSEVEPPRPASSRPGPGGRPATSPWAVALVSGLVGSVLTLGVVAATGALHDRGTSAGVVAPSSTPPATAGSGDGDRDGEGDGVVAIAEAVSPAIVRVEASGPRRSTGSGVAFRDDGHVLTNAHVVEGAESIDVVLADGSEHRGRLVGSDPLTDIAVVAVETDGPFPVAVLGSAADLRVGQPAVAIGSPLGLIGGASVTTGVVSALGRRLPNPEGPPLLDMIQTDAAIAPGSSGGALLDRSGNVIGITTAIALSDTGADGFGFATPIDIARAVAEDIIATGQATHVWLGIEGRDLDDRSAREAGVDGGAVVESVVETSPADEAGLAPGDVIVRLATDPLPSMSALVIALREHDPGEVIELEVLRDGDRVTVSVELEARPPPEE
ncbi:MAG: S1C family serine protease [Actinomycetota bacterium]|nr:S1C family serine protease [Actinomycetota bacterium]